MPALEKSAPVPAFILNDANLDEVIIHLDIKIAGSPHTDYQNDRFSLGYSLDTDVGVNRASFSTDRRNQVPDAYVADLLAKLPGMLLSLMTGATGPMTNPAPVAPSSVPTPVPLPAPHSTKPFPPAASPPVVPPPATQTPRMPANLQAIQHIPAAVNKRN